MVCTKGRAPTRIIKKLLGTVEGARFDSMFALALSHKN